VTDEQLQNLIEHKVQEATAPLERRWDSLRENIHKMILSSGWQESSAYRSVLATMNELEKIYEPRRKLPTDPRRVKK
jgi:hypothetical protein